MANDKKNRKKVTATERRSKGSVPPRIDLAEAGKIITDLYERAGSEASLDEFSDIIGNTRKSSAFVVKLQVLKKYLLITYDAEKVTLSETAEAIVAPETANQRTSALKEAFLQYEPFQEVYEKYLGRLLPEEGFLKNSFLEVGGRDLAEKWMERFKVSAEYAGLLMDRGDGKFQVREVGKTSVKTTNEESIADVNGSEYISNSVEEKVTLIPSLKSMESKKTAYQFLIDILNADMSPEEQAAVWTLIQYLKKKEVEIDS
jgi:hypothetical protein